MNRRGDLDGRPGSGHLASVEEVPDRCPGGRPSRSPLWRRRRFPGSMTRRLPDGGFARGFAAEEQRIEVGTVVVGIEVFAPLEKANYQVRKRCGNYLV